MDRNEGGVAVLDFARDFECVVANLSFLKNENHLVIFCSVVVRNHIDNRNEGGVVVLDFARAFVSRPGRVP